MPLFEYLCRACGHRFELLVRGTDPIACPQCRSGELEKAVSMFAASSEGTRQASFQTAKRKSQGVARDKAISDAEDVRNHRH